MRQYGCMSPENDEFATEESADARTALERDAEWLAALSDAIHDEAYARYLHVASRKFSTGEGLVGEPRPGAFSDMARVYLQLGEGSLMQGVFELAVRGLDWTPYRRQPPDILLCITAIPSVNGFCLRLPHTGSPAVVLNHGIPFHIRNVVHLMMGLTGWSSGTFCEHHSNDERLQSLRLIAESVVARQPGFLTVPPAADCLGSPDHADTGGLHHGFCLVAEEFIAAHELGHIALGHLDPASTSPALEVDPRGVAEKFTISHGREFEADEFAIRQMRSKYSSKSGPLRHSDIDYAVGCFFALARVLEMNVGAAAHLDTHPPASERWRSLRRGQPKNEPSAADSIDYFFDFMAQMEAK